MQNSRYISNTRTGRLDDIPKPFRNEYADIEVKTAEYTESDNIQSQSMQNNYRNKTNIKQKNTMDSIFLLLVFLLFYDNM